MLVGVLLQWERRFSPPTRFTDPLHRVLVFPTLIRPVLKVSHSASSLRIMPNSYQMCPCAQSFSYIPCGNCILHSLLFILNSFLFLFFLYIPLKGVFFIIKGMQNKYFIRGIEGNLKNIGRG